MKHRQRRIGFVAGLLVAVSLSAAVLPALAVTVAQTLTIHTGVSVYVDDVKIDAGDTHGNPDAFIYNGTTYVAVAAVSKSLGEAVKWEDSTKSVYIGKHMNEAQSLLKVCPPYATSLTGVDYVVPEIMTIAGKKYTNGFILKTAYGGSYAYFNLDGKYDTFSFDVGHVGDGGMGSGVTICDIILDEQVVKTIELEPGMMLNHYDIPVTGAKQMTILFEHKNWSGVSYGFVNAELR